MYTTVFNEDARYWKTENEKKSVTRNFSLELLSWMVSDNEKRHIDKK